MIPILDNETILLGDTRLTASEARVLSDALREMAHLADYNARARAQAEAYARKLAEAREAHPDGWPVPAGGYDPETWAWWDGGLRDTFVTPHSSRRDDIIRAAPSRLLWRNSGGRTVHVGSCPKLTTLGARVDADPKWKRCGCVGGAA